MNRILYIHHSEQLQGSGIALLNIIDALDRGCFLPMVVLPFEGPMAAELRQRGVEVRLIPFYSSVWPRLERMLDVAMWPFRAVRTIIANAFAEKALNKLVDEWCPDVIHTNSGVVRMGSAVAERNGIPHIWHIREYQDKNFGFRPLGGMAKVRELCARRGNHCVAITRGVFDHFHMRPDKDTVIYDGVFSRNATSFPRPAVERPYFLFVGSLQQGKGILDALAAFEQFCATNDQYELWIAGKDYIGLPDILKRMASAQRVRNLGFRRDVYELMAGAEALLVPSFMEGFGFITAEAMLNRCLVVGRDTAGTAEQFDNGLKLTGQEVGLRFTDIYGLAAHMSDIARRGRDSFKDMIDAAETTVHQLYTSESNASQIMRLYEQVLQIQ